MRKLNGAFFFFLAVTAARADWEVTSSQSEPSVVPGIEHRHLVVKSEDGDRATVDLAVFSAKSCAMRTIDNPDGANRLDDAMANAKCVAGVNGAYFDLEFAPIGLRIIDGKKTKPLVRARLLTGVLASSSRGIQIIRLREFSNTAKFDAALECGPFLVDLGTKVAGLDKTRSARRTFAAIDSRGHAAIGVCSDLSLGEAGEMLASISLAPDSKIWRALNLDGGSSSAFWFKRKDGSVFSISEFKTVRDFVGIVPR